MLCCHKKNTFPNQSNPPRLSLRVRPPLSKREGGAKQAPLFIIIFYYYLLYAWNTPLIAPSRDKTWTYCTIKETNTPLIAPSRNSYLPLQIMHDHSTSREFWGIIFFVELLHGRFVFFHQRISVFCGTVLNRDESLTDLPVILGKGHLVPDGDFVIARHERIPSESGEHGSC